MSYGPNGNNGSAAKPAGGREPLRLVVGYEHSSDLELLRAALTSVPDAPLKLVAYEQTAQRVFDRAIALNADLALLSPHVGGYTHALIRDLLYRKDKPIPVIGWVESRTDDARNMTGAGAMGYINLPVDEVQVSRLIKLAQEVVDEAKRKRKDGEVSLALGDVTGPRGLAFKSKTIAVYVPKGGGSHRTTTAVNLATALSHLQLGNQRTALIDLDQTKGDCHTMLGFAHESEMSFGSKRGLKLIDRGMYDLTAQMVQLWQPGEPLSFVTMPAIQKFMTYPPFGQQGNLDLLPGLFYPTDGGTEVFKNRRAVLDVTREMVRVVSKAYDFTVLDIGQDFTDAYHQVAIQEADDVLVIVPPNVTALIDTKFALRSLREHFGNLGKFRLLITGYDERLGLSEAEMQAELELPLAATIPFDPVVAGTAINTATPYVLTDKGPLGQAMRGFAAQYFPPLAQKFKGVSAIQQKPKGVFGALKGALVKEK